ncbi:MAG: DUF6702 family protein [Ferruginibacter sp.]
MIFTILKYLLISTFLFSQGDVKVHPFYVTVTQVAYNGKAQTLEIGCKIFTDDFEKTLRKHYSEKIDLINPQNDSISSAIVNDYITKHLKISVNGINSNLSFLGYEEKDEGIIAYFECSKIKNVKTIEVTNNLLYDYNAEQISIIHITVNGKRTSTKLVNPEEKAFFKF